MVAFKARAPLRLGLAGGGTDVSPYCDIHGGLVLNGAIDRYAYAVIKPASQSIVRFSAADQQVSEEFPVDQSFRPTGEGLRLHKAVYSRMCRDYNNGHFPPLELTTFCDAPIGSGLGSSSTLVVAMIRAFVELFNLPLDDYAIAQIAFAVERKDCMLQGGRQDMYSATFGGFNFMEFYDNERSLVNPLRIKDSVICELEASLLLFYTGVSRKSASIIADQKAGIDSGSATALAAMHGMKREAQLMKECLLRGDFPGIVESMRTGWESKKKSAPSVSNDFIEEIYDCALRSGALAGKVSGAGGGGYLLFFVPSEARMSVVRALSSFNGQISNCHFTHNGCQAWRI